jgi:hypothetical protein
MIRCCAFGWIILTPIVLISQIILLFSLRCIKWSGAYLKNKPSSRIVTTKRYYINGTRTTGVAERYRFPLLRRQTHQPPVERVVFKSRYRGMWLVGVAFRMASLADTFHWAKTHRLCGGTIRWVARVHVNTVGRYVQHGCWLTAWLPRITAREEMSFHLLSAMNYNAPRLTPLYWILHVKLPSERIIV